MSFLDSLLPVIGPFSPPLLLFCRSYTKYPSLSSPPSVDSLLPLKEKPFFYMDSYHACSVNFLLPPLYGLLVMAFFWLFYPLYSSLTPDQIIPASVVCVLTYFSSFCRETNADVRVKKQFIWAMADSFSTAAAAALGKRELSHISHSYALIKDVEGARRSNCFNLFVYGEDRGDGHMALCCFIGNIWKTFITICSDRPKWFY